MPDGCGYERLILVGKNTNPGSDWKILAEYVPAEAAAHPIGNAVNGTIRFTIPSPSLSPAHAGDLLAAGGQDDHGGAGIVSSERFADQANGTAEEASPRLQYLDE
jgi:hypothetical protein